MGDALHKNLTTKSAVMFEPPPCLTKSTHGLVDAGVQVSLLHCNACTTLELRDNEGVTIFGRETVTLRIQPEDWIPSEAEYEDITEVTGSCEDHEGSLTALLPPPLPPRQDSVWGQHQKRKDLKAFLGLGEEEGGMVLGVRAGQEAGLYRKDLSKFLGMAEDVGGWTKCRKRRHSFLNSFLGKKSRSCKEQKKEVEQEWDVSYQQFTSLLGIGDQETLAPGRVRRSCRPGHSTTADIFPRSGDYGDLSSGEENCRTASFSSVASSISSSSSTSSCSSDSHYVNIHDQIVGWRQRLEEQSVRMAIERGMPVIPFSPLAETVGRSTRLGREGRVAPRRKLSNRQSLESIIQLAKGELYPTTISSNYFTNSPIEHTYIDMGETMGLRDYIHVGTI